MKILSNGCDGKSILNYIKSVLNNSIKICSLNKLIMKLERLFY